MRVLTVEKTYQDTLRLGYRDRRYEVAISCNEDGFLNTLLGRKQNHVNSKQDVDSFLLESVLSVFVRTAASQPSQPD